MPEIQAFRAIRYNLGRVGSLSDVIAPPYDVISPEFQDDLYRKHPNNIVRLILNKIQPGDDNEADNRYLRAKKFLKAWQSEGVLFTEPDPAIYVYHQEFAHEGVTYVRRGFMARMRLSRFGEGQVFPHEETMPGPKIDRLMLMTVCKANLSQVFGLYPDPAGDAQAVLDKAIAGQTPVVATDHLGVVNRLWAVTDVKTIAAVAAAVGPRPVFIADGHHRYETACQYRQHVYETGVLTEDHPANFVLMMFVAMQDPGLIVLPTHRLFRGLPAMTSEDLAARLVPYFTLRPAGQGREAATEVWEDIETGGRQDSIGLFTQKDQRWSIAELTDQGRLKMAEVAKDHTDQWRGLGVSILHRLLVENLLGGISHSSAGQGRVDPGETSPTGQPSTSALRIRTEIAATEVPPDSLPKPKYVHLVQEVIDGLATGEFSLAALVMPATVDHIRTISLGGERMPAKSTYFYPKLLSGLVINPLE